jgi:hypothetical protein
MGSPPPVSGTVPGSAAISAAAKAATSECEALQALFKASVGPGGPGGPGSAGGAAGGLTAAASGTVQATCCGFSIGIPTSFKIAFKPPPIPNPLTALALLIPHVAFKLSCANPAAPVNQTSGVPWGGGRIPNAEPDPDDDENAF